MHNLDYWDQLKSLSMYSLQRRRERYLCIYVWKMLEGIVPNFGIEIVNNRRIGRYCKIPMVRSSAPCRLKSLRSGSMGIRGPKVFNSLPKSLRTMSGCSVDVFKSSLDRHLASIPDEPRVPGLTRYCSRGTNSICDF